jgi:hypothetical protein
VLPHEPDPEISDWFEERCDISIARSTREWALLYPSPHALAADGGLFVPTNEPVIIALKSTGQEPPGTLSCSNGHSLGEVELSGGTQHLVTLHTVEHSTPQIHLEWGGAYVGTLVKTPYSKSGAEVAICLVCDGALDKTRANLHGVKAQALLASVRQRHLSIVELHGHPAIRGTLNWRHPDAPEWQLQPFGHLSQRIPWTCFFD